VTVQPQPGDDVPGAPPPLLSARRPGQPVARPDEVDRGAPGEYTATPAALRGAGAGPSLVVSGLTLAGVVVLLLLRRRNRAVAFVEGAP
jgi:hypothetical protein